MVEVESTTINEIVKILLFYNLKNQTRLNLTYTHSPSQDLQPFLRASISDFKAITDRTASSPCFSFRTRERAKVALSSNHVKSSPKTPPNKERRERDKEIHVHICKLLPFATSCDHKFFSWGTIKCLLVNWRKEGKEEREKKRCHIKKLHIQPQVCVHYYSICIHGWGGSTFILSDKAASFNQPTFFFLFLFHGCVLETFPQPSKERRRRRGLCLSHFQKSSEGSREEKISPFSQEREREGGKIVFSLREKKKNKNKIVDLKTAN